MEAAVSDAAFVEEPIVGVPCFAGRVNDAVGIILERCASGQGGYCCLCNVHVLMTADRDAEVRNSLRHASFVFPDGEPLAWLLRRRGHGNARRIAGSDLLRGVADAGRKVGLRHFLFGSSEPVLDDLARRLKRDFSDVSIVGTHAPRLGGVSEIGIDGIDAIRASEADVVWVGLGAPKQELWMYRHAQELQPSVLVGVGAAFDFESGHKSRAPKWMQRSGLEWLHRMGAEPVRLGPRYVKTNARFIARVAGTKLSRTA
jgi:N-acetylglucosaminyldiphosphoundecaprenol N-acetyl-beta-D-mannosaminyltransferase